ncbi:MAG: integrase catalytic domain-containing protein [Bacteroidales bacterium]|nr:integrase catalytic domain-containing protein [Bacteroidales bacterium]
MKYKYKYELVKRTDSAQNVYPIRCRITYSGRRVEVRLGYSIEERCWNSDLQIAQSADSNNKKLCAEINSAIKNLNIKIEQIFARCELLENRLPTVQEIKNLTSTKAYTNKVSEVFEKFLIDYSHLELATVKVYKYALREILLLKGDVFINDIDEIFLSDLEKKLSLLTKNSTIRTTFERIHTVLKWARRKGLYTADGLMFKPRFKEIPKQIIYLERDELMKVFEYQTVNRAENNVRNMYCFCAFTGLRYSDMKKLSWNDVHDDYIEIVTQKTADRLRIELNKYSKAILAKYDKNESVTNKIFPQYTTWYAEKKLKIICEKLGFNTPIEITYYQGTERRTEVKPKYELITTHTARKTFVVNSIRLGIPVEIVMRWTGHKTLAAMRPYLKIVDEVKKNQMSKFDNF